MSIFQTSEHLINYNAFRKISNVRPLYPIIFEDIFKYRLRDKNLYTFDASLESSDIPYLILSLRQKNFSQINITVKQVKVQISTQPQHIKLSFY